MEKALVFSGHFTTGFWFIIALLARHIGFVIRCFPVLARVLGKMKNKNSK